MNPTGVGKKNSTEYREVAMKQIEKRDHRNKVLRPAGDAKKTYAKPEVRYEQVFETMALTCGKIRATQATCRTNRRNS